MYMIMLYIYIYIYIYIYLNYEDKNFISLFTHFMHTVKIYGHNFTHLLKISINNRT